MVSYLKKLWKNAGNLKFDHDEPALFVMSQYDHPSGPSIAYVLYRSFIFLYLLVWLLASFFILDTTLPGYGLSWEHKGFFFIFLTNWGLIIQVVDTALQAVLVADSYYKRRKGVPVVTRMDTSLKVSWCLEAIDNGAAVFITVLYWSFIHMERGLGNAFNIHKHLVNSVYVLLNLCITARPVHFIHITCLFLLAMVYNLFTVIFYWTGGRNPYNWARYVYPVLDWSSPEEALVTLAIALPLQILFYLVIYLIYKSRVLLHRKVSSKISGSQAVTLEEVKDSSDT